MVSKRICMSASINEFPTYYNYLLSGFFIHKLSFLVGDSSRRDNVLIDFDAF